MASPLSTSQGDTPIFRLTAESNGEPLDLTAFDIILFTIKRSRQDSDAAAIYQATLDDEVVPVDDDVASVDVTVTEEATLSMRPGRLYFWDLKIQDDVNIFTPCSGTILVEGFEPRG